MPDESAFTVRDVKLLLRYAVHRAEEEGGFSGRRRWWHRLTGRFSYGLGFDRAGCRVDPAARLLAEYARESNEARFWHAAQGSAGVEG